MKKFTLKEESCVPLFLTKEEYDTCVKVVKDTRAKELEKAFKSFCEVHQLKEVVSFLEVQLKEYTENIKKMLDNSKEK